MYKESKMQLAVPLPKCKIVEGELKCFVKDDSLFGICYAVQIPDVESRNLLVNLVNMINQSIKLFDSNNK